MHRKKKDERRPAMDTGEHARISRFSGTGEPRSGDVAITVLTALILLVVLIVVAAL
jgi:hypothetical protein